MKILALTKYSYAGPSSRYRFYNYQECFEKEGIEMEIQPLFTQNYFNARNKIIKTFVVLFSYLIRVVLLCKIVIFKKKYDLLLIEYELFPYFPAFFEYILYKRGVKYIVDYDDAIFHKYDLSQNIIIRTLLQNKIAGVIKYADHVIVCNEYLETYAKKYNANTLKLPTVVLLDTYKKKMQTFQKKEDESFVIGWIGSRTTSVYILDILPAMMKFMDQYENIRFELVGFDRTLLSKEDVANDHIIIKDWSEEKEIESILNFDVGIMPLTDDAWSKGKCGFKLVQYMSCKKPVIASPVGVNCSIVSNNENGFLVHGNDEWFHAFETLYVDAKLREKMANANFNKIESEYNHMTHCKTYVELIIHTIDHKGE